MRRADGGGNRHKRGARTVENSRASITAMYYYSIHYYYYYIFGLFNKIIFFTISVKERKETSETRRIVVKPLSDKKKPTIHSFIKKYVASGSTVHTDAHKSYLGIEKMAGVEPPYQVFSYSYLPILKVWKNNTEFRVFLGQN